MSTPIKITELEQLDAYDWPADAIPALLRLARAASAHGVSTHSIVNLFEVTFRGNNATHSPDCEGCELESALSAFDFDSEEPSA